MTVAARTREAVRERPFLYDALAAGVLNYTAAARFLDVGDPEAVAAALRRFAEDLERDPPGGDARVTMESGVGLGQAAADPLLAVGEVAVVPDAGSLTALLARGEVSTAALEAVLGRCRTAGVGVEAAGVAGGTLIVVVGRRDGPEALQLVEGAL